MSAVESALKLTIQNDIKTAMRSHEKARLGVLRLLAAEIKQREVDERKVLTDVDILVVLDKMLKQRLESIRQYQLGGRQDLVDQEVFEISILEPYKPQAMDEADVDQAIHAAITALQASTIKDMGKVIAALRVTLQGRADMTQVSAKVKAKLS